MNGFLASGDTPIASSPALILLTSAGITAVNFWRSSGVCLGWMLHNK